LKFTRLRVLGFKSFVEPTELVVDTHRLHFFDADTGLGIYQ